MEAGKADFTGTFKSLKATLIKEDDSIFLIILEIQMRRTSTR